MFLDRLRKCFADPGHIARERAAAEVTQPIRRTRRNFKKLYPDDMKIEVLAEANPKRPGTTAHTKFQQHYQYHTVGELVKHGVERGDIDYDMTAGFIQEAVEEVVDGTH